MLILLAASEAKAQVDGGEPFDPASLSFPQLASTREAVLDALIEVSGQPDALRRLGVRPSLEHLVRDNTATAGGAGGQRRRRLRRRALPRDRASTTSTAPSRRRAREWVVVISALWGALRLDDRVPSYRLNMCGRLPGLDHLPQLWQEPLARVLPAAADDGVIVDCRQAEYLTAWRPKGELAERTVALKAVRDLARGRGAASRTRCARKVMWSARSSTKPSTRTARRSWRRRWGGTSSSTSSRRPARARPGSWRSSRAQRAAT